MKPTGSLLVASLLAGAACAVTPLRADVATHGSLTAEVKATDGADRVRRRGRSQPQVVLFEARAVRAIDPRTAKESWVRSMAVNGHGAVTADLVLVPVVGPRLVALDRRNGEVVWLADLPGEVVVGMGASDRYAAIAMAGRRFRFQREDFGRIVLVDLADGTVRWARRSRARLGTPAVRGPRVFVPVGPSVVALSVRTGREVARAGVPVEPRRVEVARGAVLAGSGRAWVDLESARYRRIGVSGADAAVLPSEVLDLGPADDERLRWWVRATEDGSTPREGVLLARGAVVAVRFDGEGRPDRIHWIHNARDPFEYVAMHVGRRRVVLVREDGAIVQLDTADGSEVDAIAGGPPVRGALFADLDPDDAPVRLTRPDADKVLARARGLLARNDPRLLPAQRLVLETLWRDETARHRSVVTELAHGVPPVPGARVDGALRQVALDLVARPWGKGGVEARRELA
ncbi:MAG: hypothetical protein D6705_07785, partial [Deltaproteobacteria bacterium]